MHNLVIIEGRKLTTTSLVVSESFGRRHDLVLRSIDKLIKNNTIGHRDFAESSYTNSQNKKQKCYKLTERGFLIAMPFIGGKNSEKGQIVLVDAFLSQRETISNLIQQRNDPNWQNVRKDGKAIYLQKTEVIKQFVEYATDQGSTSAKKYYMAIGTMENKALFFLEQKYKNLREVLTIKQLMQVSTADDVIEKALKEGMEKKMPYKEIFKLAKVRIIAYAEIIGKSPILGLEHKKQA